MRADVGQTIECRARRNGVGRHAHELAAELFFHGGEKFLEAPGVEYVFEPRLGAISAIAMLDEDTDHSVRHHGGLVRLDDDAGIASEVLVAGDAAKHEA